MDLHNQHEVYPGIYTDKRNWGENQFLLKKIKKPKTPKFSVLKNIKEKKRVKQTIDQQIQKFKTPKSNNINQLNLKKVATTKKIINKIQILKRNPSEVLDESTKY